MSPTPEEFHGLHRRRHDDKLERFRLVFRGALFLLALVLYVVLASGCAMTPTRVCTTDEPTINVQCQRHGMHVICACRVPAKPVLNLDPKGTEV